MNSSFRLNLPTRTFHVVTVILLLGWLAGAADAATVITSGGNLGSAVPSGAVDIDGDSLADVSYVSFGTDFAALDAVSPDYGIVAGDFAFYRDTSTAVVGDGSGGNEAVRPFRGVLFDSSDNWTKMHLTSGYGWVQWSIGADNSIAPVPLIFVREDSGEDLSAFSAESFLSAPEPARILLVGLGGLGLVLRRRRR